MMRLLKYFHDFGGNDLQCQKEIIGNSGSLSNTRPTKDDTPGKERIIISTLKKIIVYLILTINPIL